MAQLAGTVGRALMAQLAAHFLREKLAAKMPTWKRFKIVEGLIWYRFGSTGAGSTEAIQGFLGPWVLAN